MDDRQDAFGHAIRDFHETGRGYEIIERDDGFISVGSGPASYFENFEDWPSHQQNAIPLARGRVLDIGCGAGRVGLYLQDQGLPVVGIDISPNAVCVARQRGLNSVLQLPITALSTKTGRFDTLIMFGNNFGLMASPKRARWLLGKFFAMTPPGARVLAESMDPSQTENPDHLAYHENNRRAGRLAGQVRIRVRYQKIKTPWFEYLFVSIPEMASLLQDTGWKITRIFNSDGPHYIACIEKE